MHNYGLVLAAALLARSAQDETAQCGGSVGGELVIDLYPLPLFEFRLRDLVSTRDFEPRTYAKPPQPPKPAFLRGIKQQSRHTAAPRGR
jgi:hypothetical protein